MLQLIEHEQSDRFKFRSAPIVFFFNVLLISLATSLLQSSYRYKYKRLPRKKKIHVFLFDSLYRLNWVQNVWRLKHREENAK